MRCTEPIPSPVRRTSAPRTLEGLVFALCACLWVATPGARAADPVPAEAFFRPPALQEVKLSPGGSRLAFSAVARGRVGLFVLELRQEGARPGVVAHFSDADLRHFEWVDEERLVFDVVDLQLGSGEDRFSAPGLFSGRFDGSELRTLVERRGRALVTGGGGAVRSLPWNHRLLHVPVATGDAAGARAGEIIVGELRIRHAELFEVLPRWLHVDSGRTRVLDTLGAPDQVVRWWFGPQGQPRAALTRDKGREALHWYRAPRDGSPGQWLQLAEAPLYELPLHPAWIGSGETLYVTHRTGPAGERVVAPFDFAQGRPGAALVVVPGFDFSGRLIGDASGTRLLGVRVESDAEDTIWLDPARKALQQSVDQALPGRVNRISCRRCGTPDEVVLVHSFSDRHPGQLLLRRPDAAAGQPRWRVVGTHRPDIDPQRMGRVSFERIRARDGRELPVWLTRPADARPGEPLPAVVLVHGGPWVRQGGWRWEPMAQFLASRGYLVIEPEFRGSAGYGAAHERAGFRQYGQAMQDDVTDALLWAQAKGIAGDKACIAGGSYGGYSTLMGLIRTPQHFRCGSAWFALADLMLYLEGGWFIQDDISDSGRRFALPERVGHPERDRAMLLAHSPVEQAQRIRTPLQLIWGRDDLRVPLAHGERLREAMRQAGLEPEWIVYDGEGHGLRKTDNRVDMALRLEAFLARHLR